ncbi:uncharacterized protein SCHCODRAFT_02500915 [Schizophyllum commune H4-8]|uniref:uncharacterized protein n=1 Tax=Schizophyllum commune (strain H4-8 / FGSC 9210) TaxID=578458 RepID=UPI00215F0CC6|nr:uncharacterized protein SCHCODRAFT_02500915 [Schizophyllum commune H4-8]KAI5893012.1 hypothetical protein SCHCODRAFT_02500915 [Schizophyllum commune H4-8]
MPEALEWTDEKPKYNASGNVTNPEAWLDFEVAPIDWQLITVKDAKGDLPRSAMTDDFVPISTFVASSRSTLKRDRDHGTDLSPPSKRQRAETLTHPVEIDYVHPPVLNFGATWADNSCAYDAVATLMAWVTAEAPEEWLPRLKCWGSDGASILYSALDAHLSMTLAASLDVTAIRDSMRAFLHATAPATFVPGQYTVLHSVLSHLFNVNRCVAITTTQCKKSQTHDLHGAVGPRMRSSTAPVFEIEAQYAWDVADHRITGPLPLRFVPGLNTTVAIPPSADDDFNRYIRTLVLPSDWTKDTIAMVRLLAAIAPRNLTSIVFGRNGRAAWYVDMKTMWTSPTMDDLMAPVLTLTVFNAPREGLHFLFGRVPSSVGRPMSALLKAVHIKASAIVTDNWSDPTEPLGWRSEEDDEDSRVVMVADTLEIDLREGIRDLVKFIYFPSLVHLTLYTGRLRSGEWQTVERLLSDSASQLRTLRLYKGRYTESDTNFTNFYCHLTGLSTVIVHWALVSHLEGIHGLIFPGQVELIVEKYDANTAEEEEYERAAPVLHLPHWRRVAFKYMLPDGSGSQALQTQRLTQLRNKAGVPWIVFTVFEPRFCPDFRLDVIMSLLGHAVVGGTKLARTLRSSDYSISEEDIRGRSYPRDNIAAFRRREVLANELEQSLAECIAELAKLAELKNALTMRLRDLRALLSPIRRLGDDDLSCIFNHLALALDNPSDRAASFARTICKVCFRWNSVARRMVNVWTYLSLQHNRLPPTTRRSSRTSRWAHFSYQASLFSNAPVHVKWDHLSGFDELSHFASKCKGRLASLVVYMPWTDVDVLAKDGFCSLRRLDLVLFHSQCLGLAALGSMLRLEHLVLSGDGPSSGSDLENTFFCLPSLRHLSIDIDPPLPSSFIALSLAGSSLYLATLHIRTGLSIDCPPTAAHPIQLPSLVDLLLERSACALIWSIRTSGLKALGLRNVDVAEDLNGSLFEGLHAMLATAEETSQLTALSLSNVSTSLDREKAAIRPCLLQLANVTTILVAPGRSSNGLWDIADILAHMLTVGPKNLKALEFTAIELIEPQIDLGGCRIRKSSTRAVPTNSDVSPTQLPDASAYSDGVFYMGVDGLWRRAARQHSSALSAMGVVYACTSVRPTPFACALERFRNVLLRMGLGSYLDSSGPRLIRRHALLITTYITIAEHPAAIRKLEKGHQTVHVRSASDYRCMAMKASVIAPFVRELVIHHHELLAVGPAFTKVHTIDWCTKSAPSRSVDIQQRLPRFLSQFPSLVHLHMSARPYGLRDVDIGLQLASPGLRSLTISLKTMSSPFFLTESVAAYPDLRQLTISHHFFAQFSTFSAEYFRRNAPGITTLNFMQGLSWASLNDLLSVTPPMVTELGLGLFPANAYMKPLANTAADTLRRLRVLKVDMRRGNDNKRREWHSLADFLHTEREKGNLAALQKLRIRVMTKRMSAVALAGNWCFALFDSGDGLNMIDWHVWVHQALGKTCSLEIVVIVDFALNGKRADDLLDAREPKKDSWFETADLKRPRSTSGE